MKLELACLVLAIALRPAPADACSCGRQRVWTAIEKTAPTNTHVLLWFADGVYKKAPAFALRETGGTVEVAVDRKDFRSGAFTVAELVPKKPLRAKIAYELVDDTGDKVLEFTTTAAKDTKPPTWKGMQEAGFVVQPGACCVCHTGNPFVMVDTGAFSDDSGKDAVVFAVWVAEATGTIDFKQPPTTYIRPWKTEFALGHPSICGRNNFDLPVGKQLKLGVRPVDLAGNVGMASELVVDLTEKPKQIPD